MPPDCRYLAKCFVITKCLGTTFLMKCDHTHMKSFTHYNASVTRYSVFSKMCSSIYLVGRYVRPNWLVFSIYYLSLEESQLYENGYWCTFDFSWVLNIVPVSELTTLLSSRAPLYYRRIQRGGRSFSPKSPIDGRKTLKIS